ncbi:MAG: ATP-dependent nuclease [Fusobacteriaceae bacterium]
MNLTSISIENWKTIKYSNLNLDNMLVLIGQNNSGKSVLLSAINFLVKPTEFKDEFSKNIKIPTRITGVFLEGNKKKITLSITKLPNNETPIFRILSDNEDKVITYEEYVEIMNKISLIYIPSYENINAKEVTLFIKKLLESLNLNETEQIFYKKKIIEKYESLMSDYLNKSLYRNILFESFKFFLEIILQKNIKSLDNFFIFFEHPEMYLHPQAERELFDILIKISKLGAFVVIETHSSRFIGLKQYSAICIARLKYGESKFFQFRGELFSGDEIKNFNMNYWINTDRGELFFAKKVILVEGQTDKIVISYLAKILNVFKYEYTIVECGSKSLIPQFSKLLNNYAIPYVAVYDKDNHFWRSETELFNSNNKNRLIHSSINKKIGKWVEFENDIEEELSGGKRERKHYRNKPFNALKMVMDKKFEVPITVKNKIKEIFI